MDVRRLSLICGGRKLNDDNATLQSLGIEHGAKLLAIGTNAAPARAPNASPAPATIPSRAAATPKPAAALSPAAKIEAVRDRVVNTLLPLVNDFISGNVTDKRSDIHGRLGETIMAELLKLDGVESEDVQVRARRKEVVKEIQGYLDSLDKALAESQ